MVVVSENSINDIHTDFGVPREHMRLVPVGVDPELFKPLPHIARQPGRLITTASADVALKGLSYLLEAIAKLRTEREISLTVIGRPKPGGRSAETIERLGLTDVVTFVNGVSDERIVELYAEAELAVVPSLYEGFSLPAGRRWQPASPSSRRREAPFPRSRARTARPCSPALRLTPTRSPPRSGVASRAPSCGPRSVPPAASGSSAAGAGRTPRVRTVEQYRELLVMRSQRGRTA